jgi:hypothetical protein
MPSETLYANTYAPNPRSAVDVLAFVLTPAQAFSAGSDAEELAAVEQLLGEAKHAAIRRWLHFRALAVEN